MSKHPLAAVTILLVAVISTLMTGCGIPTMVIQTTPEDATVWIDGRGVGREGGGEGDREDQAGKIEVRRLYYGTTLIHCRQAGALQDKELADLHHQLHADEPFSPWLFPLDFILEAITLPFYPDRYLYTAELKLRTREPLVRGKQPTDLLAIRERARQAVLAR